jgi:hypothetical protein
MSRFNPIVYFQTGFRVIFVGDLDVLNSCSFTYLLKFYSTIPVEKTTEKVCISHI